MGFRNTFFLIILLLVSSCKSELLKNHDTLVEDNEELEIDSILYYQINKSETSKQISKDGTLEGLKCERRKLIQGDYVNDCEDKVNKIIFRLHSQKNNFCESLRKIRLDCLEALTEVLTNKDLFQNMDIHSRVELLNFRKKLLLNLSHYDGKFFLIRNDKFVILLFSVKGYNINNARWIQIFLHNGESYIMRFMNWHESFDTLKFAKSLYFSEDS
ncbi:hypothetical protein [Leptospira vanthielii]|nr:hypothetical protein [Leptospira vanthielii]